MLTKKASNQNLVVTFFHRKVRSVGNYSIEFIFEDVRKRLKDKINANVVYAKFESIGLLKRVCITFEAFAKQKGVNHVTGDIYFISLLLYSRKTIHTFHDIDFVTKSKGIKHQILKFFWLTIPLLKSKAITVVSQATKNEIVKLYPKYDNKITVIPVAIAERFTYFKKDFNNICPVILQLGTAPNKNVGRLIEAIKEIRCKLVVVGARHQYLIDKLNECKIDYVYKQGLTDTEILEEYVNADIVSLVSTCEGFGMPILEGQAVGRAVITSNVLSMPEVGGNGAYYVDPEDIDSIRDGFLELINNVNLRNNLIENGLENVKRFNATVIANSYLEVYKYVAKQTKGFTHQ